MSSIAASEPISRAIESTPNANRTWRLSLIAGLSGIIFVVLLVGPLFAFGLGPSPTSGPVDVASYYAQHASVLQSIQVLRASSTLFFLVFLAGLSELVHRQARFSALAAGVIAAGVTVAGLDVVLYAARQAIALNAAQIQDPAVVQTIRDFSNALETFSSMPLAVLVVLTSLSLAAMREPGRWIGWAGGPVALLLVLESVSAASAFLKPIGVVAFLFASVWLAVLAIWLSLQRSAA
jgi:hypothetical protein